MQAKLHKTEWANLAMLSKSFHSIVPLERWFFHHLSARESKHGIGSGEEVAPHAMKVLGFIVVTLSNADGI